MNKEKSKANRNPIIDIMKCIGMICIVFGHYGLSSVNAFVYTFHLPLFFFLSGYLMNTHCDMYKFVKKKFKSLLLPYITTCLLIILGVACENLIHQMMKVSIDRPVTFFIKPIIYGAGNDVSFPFQISGIGAIWFLLGLFWGSITLRLLLNLQEIFRFLIILILTIVSTLTYPYIQLPLSLQAAGASLPFIYMGYLYRQQREKNHLSCNTQISIIVIATFLWFWNILHFNGFYLVRAYYGNGIMDFCGCFGGILWVYLISKYIYVNCPDLTRFLIYFGRYSVVLLSVHLFDLWIIRKKLAFILNLLSDISWILAVIIFFLMEFLFLFGITYLISRSKKACRLFGIENKI